VPFCDNCGKQLNQEKTTYFTSPVTKQKLWLCDECYQKFLAKSKQKQEKNQITQKKIISILIIIFFITTLLSATHLILLNQNIQDKKTNTANLQTIITNKINQIKQLNESINTTKNELLIAPQHLASIQNQTNCLQQKLTENQTKLDQIQTKYHLHNPTYDEAEHCIEQTNHLNINTTLKHIKNQGIRCGYTEIHLNTGMYELIVFNSTDEGLIYFEHDTTYEVHPKIGQNYTDCVVGNPYFSITNDQIKDILNIW
jgi:hypothetical protein